ncbi:MAG: C69 family dipeptidase [Rikenellaceae bacterium]
MKRLLLIVATLFVASSQFLPVRAQNSYNIDPVSGEDYSLSCTALLIGKDASTDGSVMTSHSCDGNYRTWMRIEPSKTFAEGATDSIYWGLLHTEEAHDMRGTTLKGTIPAPSKDTYAYLNTGYPCLNEKQLAIGETTFGGRREFQNKEGMFLIEELQRLALQRTSTAREAIKLIGELVAEFGYGDGGECLTFADKKEVWQLEIVGSGAEGKPSALWVAQRVPDDHVGISANIPRIAEVDFNNSDYFMYSADIKERAKSLGFWDGKEPFVFYKVINNEDRKNFGIRDFFVLNTLAPSLGLSMDDEELPFSVKPEKKVSPQQASAIYRETYEGTEWDMTKDLMVDVKERGSDEVIETIQSPIMNNWMSTDMRNLLNTIKPDLVAYNRTVSVCWCAYSHVIQVRGWLPDEIGAVCYMSVDNPAQSPRIPIYSGTIALPTEFDVCGQKRKRDDAILWRFRETNRLAQVAWGKSRESMEAEILRLEDKIFMEQPAVEKYAKELIESGETQKAKEFITNYTADFTGATIYSWERLGEKYWEMFGRGF